MFDSDAAAAEALASAANADANPASPAVSEQAPAQSQDANVQVDGTNQPLESFTHVDINSLPPEVRSIAEQTLKNMQADYTRKTQEIAPFRKALEDTGLDLASAQKALSFVQSLNDPDNVRALYEHLANEYGQETADEMFGGGDDDGSVDPRDRQIQELSQRLERFETSVAKAQARAELQEAERQIREAHPDLKDDDMMRIRRLAFSFDGDVTKAAEDYTSWRQSVLGSYVESKGSVDTAAVPPSAGSHAETPTSFSNLDEATKAALVAFQNDF